METVRAKRDAAMRRLSSLRLRERAERARAAAISSARRVPDPATLPGLRRFPRLTTFAVALAGAVLLFALVSVASDAIYSRGDADAPPVYTV